MSKPTSVTVELDFDKLAPYLTGAEGEPIGPGSVEGLIVDLAARELMSQAVGKDRDTWRDVLRRVNTIRDDIIAEQIRPQVEEALEASITRTNTYGEPTGKTTTLREVIVDEAKKWLTKTGDDFSSSRGPRRGETNVQHLIRQEVDKALTTELRAAVQEAQGDVLETVKPKAAEVLTESIERLAQGRRP